MNLVGAESCVVYFEWTDFTFSYPRIKGNLRVSNPDAVSAVGVIMYGDLHSPLLYGHTLWFESLLGRIWFKQTGYLIIIVDFWLSVSSSFCYIPLATDVIFSSSNHPILMTSFLHLTLLYFFYSILVAEIPTILT